MVLLEVLEQAGPGRLPSEQLPGRSGRGGAVQGHEVTQVGASEGNFLIVGQQLHSGGNDLLRGWIDGAGFHSPPTS